MLSTGCTRNGADSAFCATVAILGIAPESCSQRDIRVREIGNCSSLTNVVPLYQHLDIDRLTAGDLCELIKSHSQPLIDRVFPVGARQRIAVRIRDLADIDSPIDFGIVCRCLITV